MLSRKQYIIIIGVLSLIVFFLSMITLMRNRQSTSTAWAPTPTIPLAEPTNITQSRSVETFPSFPSPTQNPNYNYTFQNFQYPIEYENIVIDYTVGQNKMRVYYKNDDLTGARRSIKKFFAQYGFEDPIRSGVKITFVGQRTDLQ